MTDIELRDSIAKELFMEHVKQKGAVDKAMCQWCFDKADLFMEEKLKRAIQRNPIGGV